LALSAAVASSGPGVLDDAGVMAGQQPLGADPLGEVDHRRQSHLAVAEDAGVGGAALGVAADEAIDDAAAKVLLEVEREVRDAELVGERAGAEDGLGRAAGLGPVGLGVGPELDGDGDDVGAFLAGEQRGDGAVHAAGHGYGYAASGGGGLPPSQKMGRLLREASSPHSGRDEVQRRGRDALEGSVEGVSG